VAKARQNAEDVIKTTVELPSALWRAAKIRAMDERTDLRTVLIRALEQFLDTTDTRASRGKARST
jgi:hypothetical protein